MTKRPIFIPYTEGLRLVKEISIEFEWNPGFAPIQKKKNVAALHVAAALRGYGPLLEVSTKSSSKLGEKLSAFNLKFQLEDGRELFLESAYQGSKVFERGGPFRDIYLKSSREAKRDDRLRNSGNIVGFSFEGQEFPAEPKAAFYDWLYVRALAPHRSYLRKLEEYMGFTDIEFNPGKSINCQARSLALFVALWRKELIDNAILSPRRFIETVIADSFAQPYSDDARQGRLL
jgi:hypothetical protein